MEQIQQEIWKEIPGTDGVYLASSLGRIKTIDRIISAGKRGTRNLPSRLLKPKIDRDGYAVTAIYINEKRKDSAFHRLIAKTFLPNPFNYPIVHHKNGDRQDNRVENLEWCTYAHNANVDNTLIHKFNLKDCIVKYIKENKIETLDQLINSL